MNEKNYTDAVIKSMGRLGQGDPFLMADCSGAQYEDFGDGTGVFTLTYLNKDYRITFPVGEIGFSPTGGQVLQLGKQGCGRPLPSAQDGVDYSGKTILNSDQVLLLMYLRQASGLPVRGQWINFLQLPEGSHHYGPFMVDAIKPMVELFAGNRELFFRALKELGGEPAQLGDYGGIIPVFPKIRLGLVIWEGDEEFPAKGNILFDSNVPTYLDTAGAYVMGINTASRLVSLGRTLG